MTSHLTEYDQALIVIGVVAAAFLMLGIGAAVVYHRWHLERLKEWIEASQNRNLTGALKAIESVRDQVDAASVQSGQEHKAVLDGQRLISGRTQWLVANEIAKGLKDARDRAEFARKEDEDAGGRDIDGPGT